MSMEDKLVNLIRFRYAHRAHILKDKLEQAGVEAYVSEKTVFGQIDGVSVQVKSSQVADAQQVYEKFSSEFKDDVV